MFFAVPKVVLLFTALNINGPSSPIVDLPYASYKGRVDVATSVSEWLGVRYAAPPLGDLRFAAPQDPLKETRIQNARKSGPYCLAVGVRPSSASISSEDCLFLDVFAPTNATSESSLPVFVFIQGGGFASNANANLNGRGLVEASGHKIVVVTFNYRVGAYGFISGTDIASPNNGLKDQRKVLEWVQRHIAAFGGDPNHVVIGGDSAGAASVSYHLTAYGGRNDSLFHAAAGESVSFGTQLTVKESQYLYDDLASRTGCSGTDSLACLRKLSSDDLQSVVSTIPFPNNTGRPLYSWNPVIDGDLIQDYTYRAFNTGKFLHMPTIFGDDTNGGSIFAPRSTNSIEDSNKFLKTQFPYLTDAQLKVLDELYPHDPKDTYPNSGRYWRQLSDVYGDMRYTCPGLYLSSAYASRNVPSYNYLYNVQDPQQMQSGFGVPHTVEVNAIFGPGNVGTASVPASYFPGKSNADIVPVIQGYWTSFIKSYDPSTSRYPGTAAWEKYDSGKMNRFLFDTPVANSRMENVDDDLRAKCEYFWSIGTAVKQ